LGLQRVLGLGSYQTTWAMLHRFRTAMVRPGRELLSGDVEVDETFIGGVKPGKRGRGAAGKVLVAIAVEQRSPKGFGRARMAIIPDAAAPTLRAFLQAHVECRSVVITDGLKSYPGAIGHDFKHKPSRGSPLNRTCLIAPSKNRSEPASMCPRPDRSVMANPSELRLSGDPLSRQTWPAPGNQRTSRCLACIGSPRWSSVGCSAPIKARSRPTTCRHT
jgi:transposase-like protein